MRFFRRFALGPSASVIALLLYGCGTEGRIAATIHTTTRSFVGHGRTRNEALSNAVLDLSGESALDIDGNDPLRGVLRGYAVKVRYEGEASDHFLRDVKVSRASKDSLEWRIMPGD